jgi:NADPH-dependent FMN reductase
MKRSQLFTFFLTLLPHDRTVRLFHHCDKAKGQYDNFRNHRQHTPGPVFRKAGAIDSSTALKREGNAARLVDLRDFPMSFFDQPMPPAMPGRAPYEHETVKRWTAAIAASDGFVFVTPEYNYGTKNAIDWVYPEWNRKAAAFVSYGSAMGARPPAATRNHDRGSDRPGALVRPHTRRDALGAFPGRGRRQRSRRAGQASQRHDRRPPLVDGSSQGGARTIMGRQ